jgi:lambda repressor-like predicted transcriptional regulator
MSANVHDLCVEKGISLEQLSQQSGLDLPRVQAIYLGRWTPSPTERLRIAMALGVSPDEIAWGHKVPIQHIYGHGPG